MLMNAAGDDSFGFWTQQRTNALATVGFRTRNWDVTISAGLPTTVGESANIIASVDTAASSAARTRKTTGGASDNETLRFNNPRAGDNFRPAATVAASDGSMVNIREFTSPSMRGIGFSPLKYLSPTEQFLISVNPPRGRPMATCAPPEHPPGGASSLRWRFMRRRETTCRAAHPTP